MMDSTPTRIRLFCLVASLLGAFQVTEQQSLSDIQKCRDAAFAVPKPNNGVLMACCRYSKIKFRCNEGFKLSFGNGIITCRKGRVYGRFPRCIREQRQTCGKNAYPLSSGRIVGGKDSRLADWPWMAALSLDGYVKCGGSLISDSHIVTAAHCCFDGLGRQIADPKRFTALLGATNLHEPGNFSINIQVNKVFIHQDFSMSTFRNDIAILQLASSVKFTRYVRPICLPRDNVKLANEDRLSFIAGWGRTAQQSRSQVRGRLSSTLKHAHLPIVGDDACNKATRPSEPYDPTSMMCAGSGEGQIDSCSGDSGGPLMVFDTYRTKKGRRKERWTLAGVVSWGDGCAMPGTYGYYTRSTTYTKWIRGIIA